MLGASTGLSFIICTTEATVGILSSGSKYCCRKLDGSAVNLGCLNALTISGLKIHVATSRSHRYYVAKRYHRLGGSPPS